MSSLLFISHLMIQIIDPYRCVNGWMTMSVNVEADGELHGFNPWCDTPFNSFFTTAKGTRCEVRAGMCTQYYPSRRFEVQCSDGEFDVALLHCRN